MNANPPLVLEELDIRTSPAETYLRLREGSSASFLLESAVGSERVIAYSFIGTSPTLILDGEGGMESIRETMRGREHHDGGFPFMGGLVGYFSYHLVNLTESGLDVKDGGLPAFELGLYDRGIIYDHSAFKVYCFHPEDDLGYKTEIMEKISKPFAQSSFRIGEMTSNTSADVYCEGVSDLRENILDGEVFQTVLSEFEEYSFEGDPFQLYERIKEVNPSPYMYYLDFGSRKVLGSSPETLITVREKEVITYPIAGTRPLGDDQRQRRTYRNDMLHDEKERAEHVMLVDLARNDISKVCEFGSVEVSEYMRVEEYSHVQHMVSKVTGELRDDADNVDALCAVFPAGTVSGAPKHRAMKLIDRYEKRARGAYAGAVGYISDSGNLDTAIAIRSAFIEDDRIRFQAGAGIVLDSEPEKEHRECLHKLGAMHKSAEMFRGDSA